MAVKKKSKDKEVEPLSIEDVQKYLFEVESKTVNGFIRVLDLLKIQDTQIKLLNKAIKKLNKIK